MKSRTAAPYLIALALLMTSVYAGAAKPAPAGTAGGTGATRQKLIMQVSDSDPTHWRMGLGNARNVQANLEIGRANV